MGGRRRLPGLAGSLAIDKLIAYLRERIAEEEAVAVRAADVIPDPRSWRRMLVGQLSAVTDDDPADLREMMEATFGLMASMDPTRVLAECAAKRAILDLDAKVREWTERSAGATAGYASLVVSDTVKAMAQVYAYRPDFPLPGGTRERL